MWDFLSKLWSLAKPYKPRLFLGVLTGIVRRAGGAAVLIASIQLIFGALFPQASTPAAAAGSRRTSPRSFRAELAGTGPAIPRQRPARTSRSGHRTGGHHPDGDVAARRVRLPEHLFSAMDGGACSDRSAGKLFSHLLDLSAGFSAPTAAANSSPASHERYRPRCKTSLAMRPPSLSSRRSRLSLHVLAFLFSTQPKLTGLSMIVLCRRA